MTKQEDNIQKNVAGWRRLPRATMCSIKGYQAAWRFESGFRQYVVISLLLSPFSFLIADSLLHSLFLLACLCGIIIAELLNSAIESVADAVTKDYNKEIGRAKDLGSAGVFTSLVFAIVVWLLALIDYIF